MTDHSDRAALESLYQDEATDFLDIVLDRAGVPADEREPFHEDHVNLVASLVHAHEDGRGDLTHAERDVIAEGGKQAAKGYDATHDDQHTDGSLAHAAALLCAREDDDIHCPPWAVPIYAKHDQRQRLVIAARLLIAEIERLDRLTAKEG